MRYVVLRRDFFVVVSLQLLTLCLNMMSDSLFFILHIPSRWRRIEICTEIFRLSICMFLVTAMSFIILADCFPAAGFSALGWGVWFNKLRVLIIVNRCVPSMLKERPHLLVTFANLLTVCVCVCVWFDCDTSHTNILCTQSDFSESRKFSLSKQRILHFFAWSRHTITASLEYYIVFLSSLIVITMQKVTQKYSQFAFIYLKILSKSFCRP